MDISVIVVNYNTKKLTADCISSILNFSKSVSFEIILVDNASSDGSQVYLKKKFPQIKFIENKENLGFAKANNQGEKVAKGKYLFFLNSDAYLIENSLKKLFKRAEKLTKLGALAPKILNEDRTIQQAGGYFPTMIKTFFWMSFLDDLPGGKFLRPFHIDHDSFYEKEQDIDWSTGAALLIPAEVFREIKGFDEKIFMYGEDIEICYKVKNIGLKILYSPITKVVHIGRGSSNKVLTNAIKGEFIGLKYFYGKYHGQFSLQILKLFLKIGTLARIFIFYALGRKDLAKSYVEALKVA